MSDLRCDLLPLIRYGNSVRRMVLDRLVELLAGLIERNSTNVSLWFVLIPSLASLGAAAVAIVGPWVSAHYGLATQRERHAYERELEVTKSRLDRDEREEQAKREVFAALMDAVAELANVVALDGGAGGSAVDSTPFDKAYLRAYMRASRPDTRAAIDRLFVAVGTFITNVNSFNLNRETRSLYGAAKEFLVLAEAEVSGDRSDERK